ncbi:hypothetical protein MSAN_00145500 [Mycena sanguinolenta]|uniref:Uncharacterized protein n=1 Tax=Mycena sanguinolenta TaxID=230812 RepID=A0A8H6ZGC6_9AGAR|nr:hypothetical protein MSAN_00145500 [Mycena sanguinolenta]
MADHPYPPRVHGSLSCVFCPVILSAFVVLLSAAILLIFGSLILGYYWSTNCLLTSFLVVDVDAHRRPHGAAVSTTCTLRTVGGPDHFSDTRSYEPPVPPLSLPLACDPRAERGMSNFRSLSRDPTDNGDADVHAPGEPIRAREEKGKRKTGLVRGTASSGEYQREYGKGCGFAEVPSSGRGGAGNLVPRPAPAYDCGRTDRV